jgi:hypothetical protein
MIAFYAGGQRHAHYHSEEVTNPRAAKPPIPFAIA